MLHIVRNTALIAATVLFAATAAAEHRKIVDGLAINIGVVPVSQLMRSDSYERQAHKEAATGATHHVVVGVTDAKSGAAVGDARVMLELVDPRGSVQRKTLERGDAGGGPDDSGLFRFGWAGAYKLRVSVARAGAAPATATFNWNQDGY